MGVDKGVKDCGVGRGNMVGLMIGGREKVEKRGVGKFLGR